LGSLLSHDNWLQSIEIWFMPCRFSRLGVILMSAIEYYVNFKSCIYVSVDLIIFVFVLTY
jgi:hypothetical protein